MRQATGTPARGRGIGRRRALATLGALGLLPGAVLAQQEETPDIWDCGASRPTPYGMHRLDYRLKDGQVEMIRGTMHFDLDGLFWTIENDDLRGLPPFYQSGYSTFMANEAERRRGALHRVPKGPERENVTSSIEIIEGSATLHYVGLMQLVLRTPPGRADTLVPEKLTLFLPPMGEDAARGNDVLTVEARTAEGAQLARWTYEVTDAARRLSGGPEPMIVERAEAPLKRIADQMVDGGQIDFRVTDEADQVLFRVSLLAGYDWARKYAAMTGLQPLAAEAARQQVGGTYEAYRADQPEGGTCNRQGCFLTTATAGAVGLPDDCWELATLRTFRDGWLARQPGGGALTARYYRLAPLLVQRIDRRADARAVWLRTWAFGVVPAALAARLGLNRLSLWLYRAMVGRLARRARRVTPAGLHSFRAARH